MRFEKVQAGLNYVASSEDAVIYDLRPDGLFAGTGASLTGQSTRETVTATGWVATSKSGKPMTQLVNGQYICTWDGWTPTTYGVQYAQRTAQAYVDKVIKNNARILENNLICARFAYKLSQQQRNDLYNLQARLQQRNESLLNAGLVTPKTTSAPAGYKELQSYLDEVMRNGIGSVTAVIVISAIVVASLSTAAYFCYKYYASESERDVKFSDELTKTLTEKLTAEEYEQLMSETKGLVTRAKLRGRFGSSIKWLIAGALAAGAGWLILKKTNVL